jgi:hypothetical protein
MKEHLEGGFRLTVDAWALGRWLNEAVSGNRLNCVVGIDDKACGLGLHNVHHLFRCGVVSGDLGCTGGLGHQLAHVGLVAHDAVLVDNTTIL